MGADAPGAVWAAAFIMGAGTTPHLRWLHLVCFTGLAGLWAVAGAVCQRAATARSRPRPTSVAPNIRSRRRRIAARDSQFLARDASSTIMAQYGPSMITTWMAASMTAVPSTGP